MSKLLEQELEASKQLKQLLTAEQQAITGRDIPAFEEILKKKQLLLERIVQHEQERLNLLESAGTGHVAESMDEYLKECHDDGRLPDLWQRLLSMAASCRDQNRQNHQLVELCSEHTRKALCILRGESMEKNVYGPDGDTNNPHENRSLGIV
jgi:flagellar biosynthesis/type III secretory pathway chaperone